MRTTSAATLRECNNAYRSFFCCVTINSFADARPACVTTSNKWPGNTAGLLDLGVFDEGAALEGERKGPLANDSGRVIDIFFFLTRGTHAVVFYQLAARNWDPRHPRRERMGRRGSCDGGACTSELSQCRSHMRLCVLDNARLGVGCPIQYCYSSDS